MFSLIMFIALLSFSKYLATRCLSLNDEPAWLDLLLLI